MNVNSILSFDNCSGNVKSDSSNEREKLSLFDSLLMMRFNMELLEGKRRIIILKFYYEQKSIKLCSTSLNKQTQSTFVVSIRQLHSKTRTAH